MRRKIICLFLLCLFCIPGVAWAQETSDEITNQNLQGQIEASGAQELSEQAPDEAKEILSQLELQQLDYRKLLSLSPTQLWQVCKSAFSQTVRAPLLLLGTLTAVIFVLCYNGCVESRIQCARAGQGVQRRSSASVLLRQCWNR